MEPLQENTIKLKQIAKVISELFELKNPEFEHIHTKEHFLKKQRRIKPFYSDKIFSTESYVIKEIVCDEEGNILYDSFKDAALKKIGKVTYQYCCDNKSQNYFVLEVMLKRVCVEGDMVPLRIIIKHPYQSRQLETLVTDKHYNGPNDLKNKLDILLYDIDIFSNN